LSAFVMGCAVACAGLWLRAGDARAAGAIVDGDIRQLAVSADRVAALRGDELLLLTVEGQRLGRPGRRGDTIPQATPKRRASADDIIDLYGLADDDLESDLVRDALEDEDHVHAPGTGRRSAHRGAPGKDADHRRAPRALASSGDAIWIASADGLLRLATAAHASALENPGAVSAGPAEATSTLARPVGHPGLVLTALAAAPTGGVLAALAGNTVLRSGDGGISWVVLAVPPTRVRALAISADGAEVYVQDDEGVAIVTHHQRLAIFEGRAHDLARCGDELLILSDEGLFAWRWDRALEQRAGRLPAHRIACSPARAGAVTAIGSDLLSSFDGGRTWTRRTDLPVLEIQCVAFGSDRLFVGTTTGLFLIPLMPPAPVAAHDDAEGGGPGRGNESPRSVRAAVAGLTSFAGDAAFSRMRPAFWYALLPRVSLVVSAASSHPGGSRSAIWVLLTVPLGRARFPHNANAPAAADFLRRRAADAGELARLAVAAASDDESAALMRVVREDLEALP
jgi:photosystem II stability/assembly factor-like uncharacterized protein